MNIAICDNDKAIQEQMLFLLNMYTAGNNEKNVIQQFYSGEELLSADKHFDVIFLDIEMENINGMETAAEIRKTDIDVSIVILSGYTKYKNKAYALHVFDYIDKPIQKDKIFHVLKEIERYREKMAPVYLSFRTKQRRLNLRKEDILYIEYKDRTTWIITAEEAYATTYTIAELNEKLSAYEFYSPHRAYLINLYHVYSYTSSFVVMDDKNHTEIPISQLRAKEFKEIILAYLAKAATQI